MHVCLYTPVYMCIFRDFIDNVYFTHNTCVCLRVL